MRIEPVSPGNDRATAEFLTGWVTDGPADAWEYLASHTGGEGASLVTVRAGRVIGIVSVQWESNYAGFRDRGIPLVHQGSVARPARSQGVATRHSSPRTGTNWPADRGPGPLTARPLR